MNKTISTFLIILSSIIFMLSCSEDEECRENNYVMGYAKFYTITTSESGETIIGNLHIDSLRMNGLGIDSLLHNEPLNNNVSVRFPLNKLAIQSHFILNANDTIDTITIFYDTIQTFKSFECGYVTHFFIDSLNTTNHYIDSIIIKINEVNTENVEHIQIYHNPR